MTEPSAAKGPLAGFDVLDLGHYYAAPMAAMLLADQGANVVRVVRPGGPELPPRKHRLLNRNKRLIELDLATDAGREEARSLALRADVVIESYRPGVMARHGLDYESLAPTHPGLIHLSLPGFASVDVERRDIQAWEGVVAAAAALYTTGLRQRLDFPPLFVPAPVCSAFASVHGAIAVLAALRARDRGAGGVRLEVPLVNAGISTCTRSFVYDGGRLRAEGPPAKELPPVLAKLAIDPEDDEATRAEKQAAFAALAPPIFTTHQYRTADDRRLLVMPIKPEMTQRFFALLGLEGRLRAEGFVIESPWERIDPGGANNLASGWTLARERTLRVIELVESAIAKESGAHWERVFAEAGIPVTYLRTRAEWLATGSLLEGGLLTRMDEGESRLIVPGPLADVQASGNGGTVLRAREPAPIAPSELDAVFGGAAPGREDEAATARHAEEMPRKRDLLAGLKVLDLCNVVAGPNAAYTLAQLGADVIRIEPPKSFNLPMHLEWTLEVNQGKRSTILDLSTVPGREVFARLVRWADVVVHNRLDDVAERLGMTAEQLQAIDPEVVVCQNTAFGGPRASFWDRVPGYDPMPNLASGLDAFAGAPDAPRGMTEIFADLMGGLGTAFASMVALHLRERSGAATKGGSSLGRGTHHYQLPDLISEEGVLQPSPGGGPDARGTAAWQRCYACRDAWIYVGARTEDAESLLGTITGRPDATEADVEAAFLTRDASDWLEILSSIDVGAHRVRSLDELCCEPAPRVVSNEPADEQAKGPLEILCWPEHPSGLPVVLPSPAWVQVGASRSIHRLAPTPRVGAHTREVLSELGYGDDEIQRLYALRVAHDFLPAIGSADRFFHQPERLETP